MKVAFLMEPMGDHKDPAISTTLLLVQEACARGHDVYHFTIDNLSIDGDRIIAYAAPVTVDVSRDDYYTLGAYNHVDLTTFDIVWMRQDPPVDMRYITALYTLEHLKRRGVYVTNDPTAILRVPEKMSIFNFPDLIPPTLVSKDETKIHAFFDAHDAVIVKPLYGFFGLGIKKYESFDDYKGDYPKSHEPLMFQKFLPEIEEGNKKFVFIGGQFLKGYKIKPSEGSYLLEREDLFQSINFEECPDHVVSKFENSPKQMQLDLLSIDMIGNHLTEVNVTCVGSISSLNKLHQSNYAEKLLKHVEEKKI
jgi:glutathione synthase